VQTATITKIAETPETPEIAEGNNADSNYALSASIPASTKPCNEREAHRSPDWPHWSEAMQREINELTSKQTWVVVDAPTNVNIIGSRWTY